MSDYSDMDYTNYSISFLKRRLSYVFSTLNVKRKETFFELLKNKEFRDQVIFYMLVEDTEMFRDPALWRSLRDVIIDQLPQNSVIWMPDESSGEEAYSASVILHEKNSGLKTKIICNNPSIERCNAINNGVLNAKHLEINQINYRRLEGKDLFDSYFSIQNNNLVVCEKLRENVSCNYGTISGSIPDEDVSLIIFRNKAVYYDCRKAVSEYKTLIDKLMPGGFLVIGVKELLPPSTAEKMIVVDLNEKIFKKPAVRTNGLY